MPEILHQPFFKQQEEKDDPYSLSDSPNSYSDRIKSLCSRMQTSFATQRGYKLVGKMTRSRRSIRPAPFLLLVGFGLFWFSDTIADPDLWGHVRFGQDMIRARSIIQNDNYAYTNRQSTWVNHEWLSEVIFAVLYNEWGPVGLIVFKVAVSLSLLALSYVHGRGCGLGPYQTVALIVLLSIPFRLGLGTVRPQIFTYLFFLIELLLLKKAGEGGENWIWFLPIVLGIWVNLHGGVLAGAAVLIIWTACRLAPRPPHDTRGLRRGLGGLLKLGLVGFACGLALCINPYGPDLLAFLLRTATVPRPEIREWTPLVLASLPGALYLVLVAIGIAGVVGSGRPRSPETVVIFSVGVILPLMSNRHYPLFALIVLVMGGEHIADTWTHWLGPTWGRLGENRRLAGLSILGSVVLIGLSLPRFGCIRIEPFYFAFPAACRGITQTKSCQRKHGGPFRLGRVRPLASWAACQGLDRRPAGDALLGRGVSPVARS